MTYPNLPVSAGRKRVFDSVFPGSRLKDLAPTPAATPVLGSTEPGHTFGGDSNQSFNAPEASVSESIPEQVIWDRHWHTATTFLTFPDKALVAGEDVEDLKLLRSRLSKPRCEVSEALVYLASKQPKALNSSDPEQDLLAWYTNEVRRHFLAFVRPMLLELLQDALAVEDDLDLFCQILRRAQSMYYFPMHEILLPLIEASERAAASAKFRQDVHSMVAFSLPRDKVDSMIQAKLKAYSNIILGVAVVTGDGNVDEREEYPPDEAHVEHARRELLDLLQHLQTVGLGASRTQKLFAGIMSEMMESYVNYAYAGEWDTETKATELLQNWVENVFARLVVQVLDVLTPSGGSSKSQDHAEVSIGDVAKWKEMAIARLGALRIRELFDVIVEWDASKGAIQDLEHYTVNPATRTWLTSHFIFVLSSRLLQPGASTVEILQVYISIIRAFKQLDPKGVLLDRVARPVRRYLRDRDDTVKAIVGGLLSDSVNDEGEPLASAEDTLTELAAELSADRALLASGGDDGELDWNNMNWVPDPIDAAPDYKKSKDSDVIGSLISLFDSKDVFVKELQSTLAERLLRKTFDFDQEIAVLEHLKLRFGNSALQACEVMLRDVLDSRRLDNVIRQDQHMAMEVDTPSAPPDAAPELHAKILSRLFWPNLQDHAFRIPEEIAALQARYETGFGALKQSRKLTWLNALGRVTVELDLEDRLFHDDVLPWQAAVIYAFQPSSTAPDPSPSSPITRTVDQLAATLEMSAALVRSACIFWVSKRILAESSSAPNTYRVLEVLSDRGGDGGPASPSASAHHTGTTGSDATTSAAAAAAEVAAAQAAKAAELVKMQLYWQFIVAMLTNQGAMPLGRIAMMLNIVVPGGFPFSNEDLKEFLGRMVSEGKVEVGAGGNYRIVKEQ